MAAPTFARVEEMRAEGMVARIVTITSTPGNPSAGSLDSYREAARQAFEAAAQNAVQPGELP